MTFSDELTPEELLEQEEGQQYPEAFGITFTPLVSGIAIGLVGVVVAGYIGLNFVIGARENYRNLINERDNLEAQIEQQPALEGRVQERERQRQAVRSQQSEVLNLLSTEESLDTLLFELENTIQEINDQTIIQPVTTETETDENGEFKLISFQPQNPQAEVVNDGSFGTAVNGKIRRKTYNLEVVGTYTQTRSLINQIERLQPLLLINNFSTSVTGEQAGQLSLQQQRLIAEPSKEPELTSTFQLEAILPVSPEALRATEQVVETENEQGNGNNQN